MSIALLNYDFFFSSSIKIRDVSCQSLLDSLMGTLCLAPCRPLLLRLAGAQNIGGVVIRVLQISFYMAVFSEHQDPQSMLKNKRVQ